MLARGRSLRSADQGHELPAHVALPAYPVRLGNLGEREGLRDREKEAPSSTASSAWAAPSAAQAGHAITGGHVRNALAELAGDARRLMAHSLRELPARQALALLPAARVDADRAHRNPDLAGTRMRIGQIHDLEDPRAPELAETDRLHRCLRSRPRGVALIAR